tara:strand:- start:1388 stop:1576 length:189 start_codon:yes stop_codon:yes gene_type:complete
MAELIDVSMKLTREEIAELNDHAEKRVMAFLCGIDKPTLIDNILARLGQAGRNALEENNDTD